MRHLCKTPYPNVCLKKIVKFGYDSQSLLFFENCVSAKINRHLLRTKVASVDLKKSHCCFCVNQNKTKWYCLRMRHSSNLKGYSKETIIIDSKPSLFVTKSKS